MMSSWAASYEIGHTRPVERKTMFAGFSPGTPPRHRVAVVALNGVVLGDLAAPCEVFSRVRGPDGRAAYDVRVCSAAPAVASEHVRLDVAWRPRGAMDHR